MGKLYHKSETDLRTLFCKELHFDYKGRELVVLHGRVKTEEPYKMHNSVPGFIEEQEGGIIKFQEILDQEEQADITRFLKEQGLEGDVSFWK